ncbi:nudix hydrolase 2-like isoform X1 [Dioscorea cayenensis subsp. rotundata]|uniref:Nudix hydrolase 2-like isoform X1 n=3 Tax=Dioscorea cayennensis subsp. rotundata TaxID=55577 RepID=A0AB40BGA3_DIOCR|nr:nudix hydrolase 2-like isoform X1 [Dioscorea cayenensis subsp. rotundata]
MLRSRALVLFSSSGNALLRPVNRSHLRSSPFHKSHRCLGKISSMSNSANSSSVVLPMSNDEREEVGLLDAVDDIHGGVIVELKGPMDCKTFVSSLRASLSHWRQQGIRGVWIKLPIELSHLVQPAVQEGFCYHHAEPTYLMLVYWIPVSENTLPINATHRVCIGAFVMNEKREVLVVQEKCGILRGSGIWKFPTGVLEQGEDIFAGAIREVKEETGIETDFLEVLAFRQNHGAFFGKSDLFFVCMLLPLSSEIHKQESEIEAAAWMPVEEFAAQPFVKKHELLKYILDLGLAKADRNYSGFTPLSISSAFSEELSFLYLNSRGL